MPSGIRGFLAGALALVALQTLVQDAASSRVGTLMRVPGKFAARFLSPKIPAIPDREDEGWTKDNAGDTQDLRRRGASTGAPQRRYPDPWIPPTVAATTAGAGGGE